MRRDPELLRAFCRDADEVAFAELVERHLPLVYGAAQRVLAGDAHSAQDVAQTVFTALARNARALDGRESIAGWLHTVARNVAVQHVRAETRRRHREAHGETMSGDDANSGGSAEQLRPMIDEALGQLAERDRSAVLLRFLEGLSYAELGQRLELTADAARMRTERALEKLRAALARRGVTSTAAALGPTLAAHGAVAVPAGLAAQVSAVALSGGAAAAGAGTAFSLLLMTTSQKVLVALAVVAAAGVACQSWRLQERATQLAAAEQRTGALERELGETRARLGSAQSELGATDRVLTEAEQLIAATVPTQIAGLEGISPELKAWVARSEKLRALAASLPERTIPELALMKMDDWMFVARQAEFGSDEQNRKTLMALRAHAKSKLIPLLRNTLNAYLKANDNTLPPSISALGAYLSPPLTEAMLGRYRMAQTGKVEKTSGSDPWVVEADRRDDEYETEVNLTRWGSGSRDVSAVHDALVAATRAFRAANANRLPKDAFDIVPYLANPADPKLLDHIERATGAGLNGLSSSSPARAPINVQYKPRN